MKHASALQNCPAPTRLRTSVIDLDLFSERARLAPHWPLRSSQLNTASVHYLLDLSRLCLLSPLFLYYFLFFIFFVSLFSRFCCSVVDYT